MPSGRSSSPYSRRCVRGRRVAGGLCLGSAALRTGVPPARHQPRRLGPRRAGKFLRRGRKVGAATGPTPTDRGRHGTKRHLVTNSLGIPPAFVLTGAGVDDSVPLDQVFDAISAIDGKRGRPRRRPRKLHADKAYDHRRCRRACRRRGITPRIARRGVETSERLGRYRWVIERTFAWLNRFRRLTIR
jgi:IS5 family transposase